MQFVIHGRALWYVREQGDRGDGIPARLIRNACSGGGRPAGGMCVAVSGPESWDITSGQSDPKNLVYGLVKITPRTVEILAANNPQIAGEFVDRRGPETIRFGIGDILSITIFESGPGGLFTPPESVLRTGNYVTLPPQSVDDRGYITVPYAGPMRARGRTAMELQQAIIDALKNAALKPQVVVSLVEQRATAFTVLGEVPRAGRFPVLASGERILDAIARAGGITGQGNESWVVFERGGRRAMAPFGAIVDVPANNIYVRANDIIYVFREPQTFLAFGAVGVSSGGGRWDGHCSRWGRGGAGGPIPLWRVAHHSVGGTCEGEWVKRRHR